MTIRSLVLLFLLAMLGFARPARAAESYANCTGFISAPLPATITTPGTWCVKGPMLSLAPGSKVAITIAADDVTFDCNHFEIQGGAAGQTGIYTKDHFNVRIRNCAVFYFDTGIYLQSTTNTSGGRHVVEDNIVDDNVATGIRVEGDGSVVRRNQVSNNGVVGWTGATSTNAYGVYGTYGVDISGNTISVITAVAGTNGSAFGIYTSRNANGSIDGNRISGLAKDGTGKVYGIYNNNSGRITIRDNQVTGDASAGSLGLNCSNLSARAVHNVIGGFVTALQACGDAGDNDVTP